MVRFRREKDGVEGEAQVSTAVAEPGPIDVEDALSGVTRQIEEITESAERRAAALRAEAESDADRTREEARIESERVVRESRAEAEREARARERAASETVTETRRAVDRVNEAIAGLRVQLDQVTEDLREATATVDVPESEYPSLRTTRIEEVGSGCPVRSRRGERKGTKCQGDE